MTNIEVVENEHNSVYRWMADWYKRNNPLGNIRNEEFDINGNLKSFTIDTEAKMWSAPDLTENFIIEVETVDELNAILNDILESELFKVEK